MPTSSEADRTAAYWAFEDSLGYLARLVFRSFSMLREAKTREHGVSAGHWPFLRQLWREDGVSQHELSRRLVMQDATTAVALRGLEKEGLIHRRVNRRDRRETLVYLTPHARALAGTLLPVTREVQAAATRGLSPEEVERLRGLLFRIVANLAEEEFSSRC
ncbi:MarR family winged helix-turn-helix transcriptional regulator [Sphingopyxis indica]|uniref:MarR family winged helix-turn-helix transcriptional regulator n=1 Tax=Sphingopyxis indica TaxID=436663 RepID=UPI00293927B3|nr:MarR family winged helix-turn-helix transcriptional regulator [Sphingopyxis indica]WOF42392.1 MarR family winged helix-turn-helix transcriptional regulator [Sphingopyxis indica]